MNTDPLSDTMEVGRPWFFNVAFRNIVATCIACVPDSLNGVKVPNFVKRSTMTKMLLFPSRDVGKPTMESIDTESQGPEGIGSG